MPNMERVADWLMRHVADEGIKHVFVLPGGGAMHLNDALACQARLTSIPCQHEQACGIAAEAYGRTGQVGSPNFGVVMVTTGPGATNAITPVAGAWIDSIPLLVISGQAKRADLMGGRNLRQTGVQEVDIISVVKPLTKFAAMVNAPEQVRVLFEQALYEMRSGRPGPVWLDIPLDVQAAHVDASKLAPWVPPQTEAPEADNTGMQQVAQLLRKAKRPLLLAGHGVRLAGGAQVLQDLVEHLQLPCVFTWNALDLLPFDHSLNVGRPGVVATRAANFAVQNADLLLCVGARLDPVVTGYNRRNFGRSAHKIVVDIDPNELTDKSDMPGGLFINSDARFFLSQLNQVMRDQGPLALDPWRHRCLHWKQAYSLHCATDFPQNGPISHAHFVEAISDALPINSLIATGSSGLAIEFLYAGFRNKPGQRMFLTSGLGAMGYGLPAAIGASLGASSQACGAPVIGIESDGSLQLNLQELATLATNQLPVCLFIMNNEGYASIRNTQRNYFSGRYLGSDSESGLSMPPLSELSHAYGIAYADIQDALDLRGQIHRALTLPRPCLINVLLIKDEALQPKCAAIPQPGGGMLSMPLEDMSPLLSLEELQREMLVPLDPSSLKARSA